VARHRDVAGGSCSGGRCVRELRALYERGRDALPRVLAVLLAGVLPTLLWRRWRYEIRPLEIDLQRGLVRVTRTLVPMARVQHVDTRRGPLQRRLGLSTVVFYTAAGPNEIPQLAQKTAAEVRDRIAELTRTADEL